MSSIETKENEKLFGSGAIWIFTCVVVTVLPTFLSCVFRWISENENPTVSIFISKYLLIHFKDILLITFSISCNLFALFVDNSKLVNKNLKKIGVIFSVLAGILSGCYYFYIDGKGGNYGKNGEVILIFYICLSFCCSIMGYIVGNKHDKNVLNQYGISKKKNKEN